MARLLVTLLLAALPAASQLDVPDPNELSRDMRQAIELYRQNRNEEAMDRFLDILVKGDPAEKALANDYLTRITRRMNMGEYTIQSPQLPQARPPVTRTAAPSEQKQDPEAPVPVSEERQELMTKQIKLRLEAMRGKEVQELSKSRFVQVLMERENVRAVGLLSEALFKKDVDFRFPEADRLLNHLTGLVFTVGDAQVLIIPEGYIQGAATIRDMRRAMAVGSFLTRKGVASPRLHVNLMDMQVDMPTELRAFKGVVLLFLYDRKPVLSQQTTVDEEAGPQISLGIHPNAIDPRKSDGSIIEFSVLEPPIGLGTWKFTLVEVDEEGKTKTIQEVVGDEPVFHQIFWNGRKDFFGDLLPSGRYLVTLAARDIQGRERLLRENILVQGPPREDKSKRLLEAKAEEKKPVVVGGARGSSAARKEAENAPKKTKTRAIAKGRLSRIKPPKASAPRRSKKPSGIGKAKVEKVAMAPAQAADELAPGAGGGTIAPATDITPAPAPAPAQQAPPTGGSQDPASGAVRYEVGFFKNTANITPDGEKKLEQVSKTMSYWPLAKLTLVGYAFTGEPNAASMADKRVQVVSSLLVSRFRVPPDRIQVESKLAARDASKVEIYLIGSN